MEKETKSETKKGSDGKKKAAAASSEDAAARATLKFLTPEALAGAIVGQGGSKIAAMRTENKAGVQLSDRKETYPGTDCRQLTLHCDTEEALLELATKILKIQLELISPEELAKSKNQWSADSLGKDGELKICLLVPRAAGGGIIGKGGAVIKQLRESSGVKKMTIGEPNSPEPGADQMVNVVGSLKACQTVIKEVSKQVQALNGEGWFGAWLASTPASSSGWRGGGSDANWGWNDWNSWNWNSGWNDGWNSGGQGLDTLVQVARETPRVVLEDSRGFAMNCTVPKNLTGGLIGRRGQNVQSVKERTNADISIRPIPDDPDHNSLNIVGPLPNACAAYMLMMKLYLDAEESAS
jgi:transcription antitermination factor NusA-like protein